MTESFRFGLNRMIYPNADLETFFGIAAETQIKRIELRNDLPGESIIDDLTPDAVRRLTATYGIEIVTINALQHFNLPERLGSISGELEELIELAQSIDCAAVVLCPNNDRSDGRSTDDAYADTVAALRSFRRTFEKNNIIGYVEPLGFPESSQRSVLLAQKAIHEAGGDCYKIVYDTFHHYLGPDTGETIEREFDISLTGIVHASGVSSDITTDDLRDEHRGLIDETDRLGNTAQLRRLKRLGFGGIVSFEPFSPRLAEMERSELVQLIGRCTGLLSRV